MYRIRNLVGEGYFSGYSSGSPGDPIFGAALYLSYEDLISVGEVAATLRNSHGQRVKVETIVDDTEVARTSSPNPEPISC
jgi:hypothetical protein